MTDKTIVYDLKTYSGQGGSPIIKKEGSSYYLVGIHQKKKALSKKNNGIRLNAMAKDQIKIWISQN